MTLAGQKQQLWGKPETQSIFPKSKRSWRTSDIFNEALSENIGIRTRDMGIQVHKALTTGYSLSELIEGKTDLTENNPKVPEEKARKWALSIAGVFGKLRKF